MPDRPPFPTLTPRLEKLLDLAGEGVPDKAIASELGVSPHTVDASWRRLRKTFGTANRAETIACHAKARESRRVDELCTRISILEGEAEALREANARLNGALEERHGPVVRRLEASARAALADREEQDRLRRLKEAVESSDTMLYEGEIGGLWRKYWATENTANFGFSATSFASGETRIADLVPAQDMVAVLATFERALAEGEKNVVVFYRIRRPEGTLRWIRDCMTILRDERGEPVRYFGCATDITDLAAQLDPALLLHPAP